MTRKDEMCPHSYAKTLNKYTSKSAGNSVAEWLWISFFNIQLKLNLLITSSPKESPVHKEFIKHLSDLHRNSPLHPQELFFYMIMIMSNITEAPD